MFLYLITVLMLNKKKSAIDCKKLATAALAIFKLVM